MFLLDVVGRTCGEPQPVILWYVPRGEISSSASPDFAAYRELTERRIPIAVLERRIS